MDDCLARCNVIIVASESTVFDAVYDCFIQTTCENLDVETCMAAGMAASGTNIDNYANKYCSQVIACLDVEMTQEECKQVPFVASAVLYKQSIVDCAATCVEGLTCEQFGDQEGIMGCLSQCGVPQSSMN
jgi:hypothetical protein